MSRHLVTGSVRAYEHLLILYSPPFRARFGREMVMIFAQLCEDADIAGGTSSVLRLWWTMSLDLAFSAVADRAQWTAGLMRSWWACVHAHPATAARQFVFATLGVFAVGKLVIPGSVRRSASPAPLELGNFLLTLVAAAFVALVLELVLRCLAWLEPLLRTSR